jgi:hypothetical protein
MVKRINQLKHSGNSNSQRQNCVCCKSRKAYYVLTFTCETATIPPTINDICVVVCSNCVEKSKRKFQAKIIANHSGMKVIRTTLKKLAFTLMDSNVIDQNRFNFAKYLTESQKHVENPTFEPEFDD